MNSELQHHVLGFLVFTVFHNLAAFYPNELWFLSWNDNHVLVLLFFAGSGIGFAVGFGGGAWPFEAKNDRMSGMLAIGDAPEKIQERASEALIIAQEAMRDLLHRCIAEAQIRYRTKRQLRRGRETQANNSPKCSDVHASTRREADARCVTWEVALVPCSSVAAERYKPNLVPPIKPEISG